jgi:hypothetical protein
LYAALTVGSEGDDENSRLWDGLFTPFRPLAAQAEATPPLQFARWTGRSRDMERAMKRLYFSVLIIVASVHGGQAWADDIASAPKVVSEVTVKMISDLTYADLLGQAMKRGWCYTPAQIESGYRRHFEEFKLQLMDQGYIILAGEAGA